MTLSLFADVLLALGQAFEVRLAVSKNHNGSRRIFCLPSEQPLLLNGIEGLLKLFCSLLGVRSVLSLTEYEIFQGGLCVLKG